MSEQETIDSFIRVTKQAVATICEREFGSANRSMRRMCYALATHYSESTDTRAAETDIGSAFIFLDKLRQRLKDAKSRENEAMTHLFRDEDIKKAIEILTKRFPGVMPNAPAHGGTQPPSAPVTQTVEQLVSAHGSALIGKKIELGSGADKVTYKVAGIICMSCLCGFLHTNCTLTIMLQGKLPLAPMTRVKLRE